MNCTFSRRRFLASVGTTAAGLVLGRDAHATAPPRESGLSFEGLMAGHEGFQRRSALQLPYDALPGFLSREQLSSHYAEYAALVTRLQAAEKALQTAQPDKYAELRRTQVATANAVLLHELYFSGLSATKVEPAGYIQGHMSEHMGSWESWQEDFRQCALAAKAWVALVYDPYDDRWHNAIMDSDDGGVWIGANPLAVCDVSAHAFDKDYQSRDDYVTKFFDHVDWEEIARRYRAVDRM